MCGDPSVVLDPVEEARDHVSRPAYTALVLAVRDAVGARRDDRWAPDASIFMTKALASHPLSAKRARHRI